MPPSGARLVWITPEQDAELGEMVDGSEILNELIPLTEIRCGFDAAPRPVKRRRCAYHYAEAVSERAQSCWKARERRDYRNCSFVTVWEVPDA